MSTPETPQLVGAGVDRSTTWWPSTPIFPTWT